MKRTTKGTLIALGVAALFTAQHAYAGEHDAADANAKKSDGKVNCVGINECKGKGECAGAGNSCAGMNSCKGKGVVTTTEEECKQKGGKVVS